MSQEKLNHVVTGVLNDFMAFLTARKEQITLSSSDAVSPAVEAIKNFLLEKNIEYADPLFQWEDRCSKINKTYNSNVKKAMDTLRNAMISDPDYAWGWHCNIACLMLDEGLECKIANKKAASFMKLAFNVDTINKEECKTLTRVNIS